MLKIHMANIQPSNFGCLTSLHHMNFSSTPATYSNDHTFNTYLIKTHRLRSLLWECLLSLSSSLIALLTTSTRCINSSHLRFLSDSTWIWVGNNYNRNMKVLIAFVSHSFSFSSHVGEIYPHYLPLSWAGIWKILEETIVVSSYVCHSWPLFRNQLAFADMEVTIHSFRSLRQPQFHALY